MLRDLILTALFKKHRPWNGRLPGRRCLTYLSCMDRITQKCTRKRMRSCAASSNPRPIKGLQKKNTTKAGRAPNGPGKVIDFSDFTDRLLSQQNAEFKNLKHGIPLASRRD